MEKLSIGEYTIPEGMEAIIENGKIILREKEDDDERIRKEIYNFLIDMECKGEWIAYIEKQKQKVQWPNLSNCKHDCKTCFAKCIYRKEQNEEQKPESKRAPWTPKFKVGDLFIYGMSQEAKLYTVKLVDEQDGCVPGYWCERLDAPTNGNVWFSSSEEKYMEPELEQEQKPAEWGKEDKEMLIKVEQMVLKHWNGLSDSFYHKYDDENQDAESCYNWLKSLPERFVLQPHTVSIKDATKFGNLEYERGVKDGIQSEKSRQWKPSEEQMEALYNVEFKNFKKFGPMLESLYNDLKKLQ